MSKLESNNQAQEDEDMLVCDESAIMMSISDNNEDLVEEILEDKDTTNFDENKKTRQIHERRQSLPKAMLSNKNNEAIPQSKTTYDFKNCEPQDDKYVNLLSVIFYISSSVHVFSKRFFFLS